MVDENLKLKDLKPLAIVLAITGVAWYLWHRSIIQSMPSEVDKDLFSGMSNATLIPESWADQKANGVWLTFNYLRQLFWPLPLVSDYSPESLKIISSSSWQFLVSGIVLSATLWLSFKFRNSWSWMAFSIFSWFVFIAPASNIFLSIGTTYAERLAFTPSFAIVFLGIAIYKKLPQSKVQYALLGFAIFFGLLSYMRIPDWESDVKLFGADVEKFPNNYKLHYNYGTHLAAQVSAADVTDPKEIQIVEQAIEEYKKGIKLQPKHADAYNNLGNAYRRIQAFDEAIETYNSLLEVQPNYLKAYYNRGITYFVSKQYKNAQKDLIKYGQDASGYNERGAAWYWAGVSSGHLAEFEKGIECLKKSIEIDDSRWDAWNFLGMAYGNLGQHKKALEAFQRAYQLDANEQVRQNVNQAQQALNNM
jgi:tetratricopeptide (TPR) repeat protein